MNGLYVRSAAEIAISEREWRGAFEGRGHRTPATERGARPPDGAPPVLEPSGSGPSQGQREAAAPGR